MSKQVRVRKGLFATQAQQARQVSLSANSVNMDMLETNLKAFLAKQMFVTAVVGSSTDLTLGRATHTSIASAVIDVPAGSTIFVLPGTYSETVTIPTNSLNIIGSGNATVITLLMLGGSNCLVKNVRCNIIQVTGSYNILREIWTPSTGAVYDVGANNIIEVIKEA